MLFSQEEHIDNINYIASLFGAYAKNIVYDKLIIMFHSLCPLYSLYSLELM